MQDEAPKVERKGKYALIPPNRIFDWWQINDMERMYAVVTIHTVFADYDYLPERNPNEEKRQMIRRGMTAAYAVARAHCEKEMLGEVTLDEKIALTKTYGGGSIPNAINRFLASRRAKPAEKALSLEERVVAQNQPAPDGLWTVLRDGIREPFAFTSQESADLYRICLITELRAGGGQ